MKKILILIITIFVYSLATNAQSKTNLAGIVVYKFSPNVVSKKNNSEKNEFEKLQDRFIKESKTITFNLKFKQNVSFFYVENTLENDDTPLGLHFARSLVVKGNYHTDLKKKQVIRDYKGLGESFLVSSKTMLSSDWKLSKESKMIGKYKCFKATTSRTYKAALGHQVTYEVVAWYAPQIPVRFGLKEYNGLPGLILELKDQRYTFYASKISFVNENEIVIKPIKGKAITEEEYLKQVEKSSGFLMLDKKN
ncbi:GLPGLI family protein [Kordia sp.]|uniref:GLPGLI family protein n=1 Tax=Kordia sp. TaxID=1965332 RepID=UPI003D6BC349